MHIFIVTFIKLRIIVDSLTTGLYLFEWWESNRSYKCVNHVVYSAFYVIMPAVINSSDRIYQNITDNA